MVLAFFLLLGAATPAAKPQPTPSASAPPAYADFVKGATVQPGLIPIVTKDGKVYLALSTSQLGRDFIETSVPATGLGGFGPAPGEPYVAPARILHFERVGDQVVMRWPNTLARVVPRSPQQISTKQSFPDSVIAISPIAAQDDSTVVISADAFLGDVANFSSVFDQEIDNPLHGYRLDSQRTFFARTKAFPDNDVLHVSQTWQSDKPNLIDNAPDPRSIEVDMAYNIIAAPSDGYMPRIADPRVGYFEQGFLDFTTDNMETRGLQYIARWNFAPQTPGRPSDATHPIVYYLSDTIPQEYRETVRKALLTWNDAYRRIGILNAIQVQDEPDDPNWDPEDIRHNMVRWISTTQPAYGAEALIVTDPRNGEELNVGVNVDATGGAASGSIYRFLIAPARGLPDTLASENGFNQDFERAIVLHESGHDMGLQHNFIGSMAYTRAQLQSKAFTAQYGIASSVMEYAPIANLWPKHMPNGEFEQLVLGPYDYYAIRYGYAYIPNAHTPAQELPVLRRWASDWANPMHRFASDEDAGSFSNGHSIDPRVEMFDLSDNPSAWCDTYLSMWHDVMNSVANRFPMRGRPYDEARMAFLYPLNESQTCLTRPADTIGGEYISRDDAGDPHSGAPLRPVPRANELAASKMLDKWLFSDAAWHFNPQVLTRLTYSELSSVSNGATWFYNPGPRHDVPIVEIAAATQDRALHEMFAPLTLQRIDDLQTKYPGNVAMNISDLFSWTSRGIYGELASGGERADGVVRRNLQIRFAKQLGAMWTSPAPGTPSDAQALARLTLQRLLDWTSTALRSNSLDDLTRAHVVALQAIAKQAIEAHATIASPLPDSTP